MKTAPITVTYDAEKLAALRQYAVKKDVSVEAELGETIEKLYKITVPAPVREYIENKPVAEPSARPPRPRPAAARPGTE